MGCPRDPHTIVRPVQVSLGQRGIPWDIHETSMMVQALAWDKSKGTLLRNIFYAVLLLEVQMYNFSKSHFAIGTLPSMQLLKYTYIRIPSGYPPHIYLMI